MWPTQVYTTLEFCLGPGGDRVHPSARLNKTVEARKGIFSPDVRYICLMECIETLYCLKIVAHYSQTKSGLCGVGLLMGPKIRTNAIKPSRNVPAGLFD